MQGHDHGDHAHEGFAEIGVEAFGVPVTIRAPADVLPRVADLLRPGWRRREPSEADERFVLRRRPNGIYRLDGGGESISGSADLQIALAVLESRTREYVAAHASDHVFVRAGAVAHRGRAMVLPGPAFSGKTTLVAELVRAGARFISDEYAIIDAEGLVHTYAAPAQGGTVGHGETDGRVPSLHHAASERALPVGLIVVTEYSPGGRWNPRHLSPGEAALKLIEHAVGAEERAARSVRIIAGAVQNAVALEGERGEAPEIVAELLDAAP